MEDQDFIDATAKIFSDYIRDKPTSSYFHVQSLVMSGVKEARRILNAEDKAAEIGESND